MNDKETAIRSIVDTAVKVFADTFSEKHISQASDPDGVINSKKNNCFMAALGDDFMIYSALSRSFDSSFGTMLETMGRNIARLSYQVLDDIDSILLPEQDQHIRNIISSYDRRDEYPKVSHYDSFTAIIPKVTDSYRQTHKTDNFFYDENSDTYYIIELKAGGDLDNKKAKSEKSEILREYFMLRNKIAMSSDKTSKVKIFFATAYNRYGEGQEWKQERVLQYFSRDELLIGRNYWNFICGSENGFDIVIEQYQKSSIKIREAISNIKAAYHV
jgi:hypothetical protein